MNPIEEKLTIIRKTSQTLAALAKQSYKLDDPKEASEAEKYDNWLAETAETLSNFADSQENLMNSTREMQEMNMSFNTAYLEIQNKISHENRQFTLLSNIMKNKHDTAKTAINNIR
jgi:hypothetical protein